MDKLIDNNRQFSSGWEWQQNSEWMDHTLKRTSNYTGVRSHRNEKVLFGSLIYYHDPEDEDNPFLLHYYVTQTTLLTNLIDMGLFPRMNENELFEKMEMSESALDGFFILLAEIANTFLDGIDNFEDSLRTLEKEMKEGRNQGAVFDAIVEHRFLLLHWTSLTIALQETLYSAKEVFMENIEDNREFQRTKFRIERLITLHQYYEKEINTLLSIDDIITNYRGNEIVRALTIFTVIFTPVMALAAVWGMNFTNMPLVDWEWGFVLSLVVHFTSMFIVYLWLRKKGWVGDLLKGKKSG
jgi:magnesium transporter